MQGHIFTFTSFVKKENEDVDNADDDDDDDGDNGDCHLS